MPSVDQILEQNHARALAERRKRNEVLCQQMRREFRGPDFVIEPAKYGVYLFFPRFFDPIRWFQSGRLDVRDQTGIYPANEWTYFITNYLHSTYKVGIKLSISDTTYTGFYRWKITSLDEDQLEFTVREALTGFKNWYYQ